jgi:hypothetical protein
MISNGDCSGSLQKGWNRVANAVNDELTRLRAPRPKILARRAVAHIELIPDNGKQHRMRAEQKVAVGDGVQADVGRDVGCAPAVPARTVAGFRRVGTR